MARNPKPVIQPFSQVRSRNEPAVAQLNDSIVTVMRSQEERFKFIDQQAETIGEFTLVLSGSLGVISGTLSDITGTLTNVSQSVVTGSQILNGRSVGPTAIAAQSTATVAHGLGRVPNGYFISDMTSGSIVFRTSWNSTNLTLSASDAVSVNLWVF